MQLPRTAPAEYECNYEILLYSEAETPLIKMSGYLIKALNSMLAAFNTLYVERGFAVEHRDPKQSYVTDRVYHIHPHNERTIRFVIIAEFLSLYLSLYGMALTVTN